MQNLNAPVQTLTARDIVTGDLVEVHGEFMKVLKVTAFVAPISRDRTIEIVCEGYGTVSLPAFNTVRLRGNMRPGSRVRTTDQGAYEGTILSVNQAGATVRLASGCVIREISELVLI